MTVYCIAITFALAFVMGVLAGLLLCKGKAKIKNTATRTEFCPDAELLNFLNYNGEQQ
jgi:hypothetical protein